VGSVLAAFLLAPVPSLAADRPGREPFHLDAPTKARGATIARVIAPTFARRFVASARHARRVRASTAWSHQAQVLLVLAATTHEGRDWVKVRLANRPKNAAGWIPRDHVRLGHRYWPGRRQPARPPGQRALPRLHSHRQPQHLVAGQAHPARHTRPDPPLSALPNGQDLPSATVVATITS
jgi:hypothetical protein